MKPLAIIGLAVALTLIPGARAAEITPAELAAVRAHEAARVAVISNVYGTAVCVYGLNIEAGGGSGVLIDKRGYLLTNNHVAEQVGPAGWGGLADGKLHKSRTIGVDPTGDLALMRLEGSNAFPFARLGRSDRVQAGDPCFAIGNPFSLATDQRPTVTLGIISAIHRYQRGAANRAVYGNCLQIDASINPGNSGGPLFNFRGEVIGINGRGAFEERPRVNVGLGFAIPVEQIKNFLPDLRAAKTCQHGSLDATFTERDGRVVCAELNRDADIAKLGLALADRLVMFDGHPIRSVNEFAGLISGYPARWPVTVTFEHEGRVRTVWTRLRALPFALPQAPRTPGTNAVTRIAGAIRNLELNRTAADEILADWRDWSRESAIMEPHDALLTEEDVLADDQVVGRLETLRAGDGRSVTRVLSGAPGEASVAEPAYAQCRAALASGTGTNAFQELVLEGGDRTGNERAYRLRITDAAGRKLVVWFSLLGADGEFETRLLKIGTAVPEGEPTATWTFSDYRAVAGMRVPHRIDLVEGLGETVKRSRRVVRTELIKKVDPQRFAVPAGGGN